MRWAFLPTGWRVTVEGDAPMTVDLPLDAPLDQMAGYTANRAVNAVAYKGCRVEVAGFRSNTAPRLIDVADFFIDLGDIAELIRKDSSQSGEYEVPSFIPPEEMAMPDMPRGRENPGRGHRSSNRSSIQEKNSDLVRVNDD